MGKIYLKKIQDNTEMQSFVCNNNSIEYLIKYESYFLAILNYAYAYKFCLEEQILGYYMIRFRKIFLKDCPQYISECYSEKIDYCVSVHIDYIEVASRLQGRGIGTMILKIIIVLVMKLSKIYPVRLVTVDALKELYLWYSSIGFLPFDDKILRDDNSTITMYMDCISKENIEKLNKYQDI